MPADAGEDAAAAGASMRQDRGAGPFHTWRVDRSPTAFSAKYALTEGSGRTGRRKNG
jgi:hypothetical protein